MKLSNLLMPTLREVPAEAEITSHKLMMRAGLMRKLAAGVYSYLPLGLKTLHKIENIIREEMDDAGAQELLMSALLPAEYYQASHRWDVFGPEMFRLKDRNDRDFCLGPTHEEIFTMAVKNDVHSYKDYPMTLYQMQTKYRDERRPRFGVMRSREFIMKDAYSFDLDEAGLDVSYQKMYEAYNKIFTRLGLDFTVVQADSGAMGGSGSQEFMVKSEIGEDGIAYCEKCNYAANTEKAEAVPVAKEYPAGDLSIEKIETPDVHTIEELTEFMGCAPYLFAKTMVYRADDKYVAAMVRGDREVNETKLQNEVGAIELELADAGSVRRITNAEVGFAGPVGLSIPVYIDREVAEMKNFVVGANETNYHLKNVNVNRDFTPAKVLDLRLAEEGDTCPVCGGKMHIAQGIEVGHIFKLGTKYSEALDLTYLDENGKAQTVVMGCYGIGVNRCMAAVIEQNNDDNGIVWPVSVAPYEALVIPVNVKNEEQMAAAEKIYAELKAQGIEVLMDDRDERPGVKFKDADLIGIPVRITVGKKIGDNIVEYKLRKEADLTEMSVEDAVSSAVEFVRNER